MWDRVKNSEQVGEEKEETGGRKISQETMTLTQEEGDEFLE